MTFARSRRRRCHMRVTPWVAPPQRQYDNRIPRRTPRSLALACAVAAATACCAASAVLLAARVLQGPGGAAVAIAVIVLCFGGIVVVVRSGMQRPLQRLLDVTAARARVAADLSASQPL